MNALERKETDNDVIVQRLRNLELVLTRLLRRVEQLESVLSRGDQKVSRTG